MAGGFVRPGLGPSVGFLDHNREGDSPRPSLPDITPDSLPTGNRLPLAPPHLPRGRGTHQLLRQVRLCPKRRRDARGPLTCPMARIKAAQARLRDVLRWLERPVQGASALQRAVQHGRAALRRRLGRIRALGPEYADFEPGGSHDRLASLASFRRLHTALAGKVRATVQARTRTAFVSGAPG